LEIVRQLEQNKAALTQTKDEAALNTRLEKQSELLASLMQQIKQASLPVLPEAISEKRRNFLKSRIAINQERGNTLAVLRDRAELESANVRQAIRQYLRYLNNAANSYAGIEEVVSYSQKLLEKNRERAKSLQLPQSALLEMSGVAQEAAKKLAEFEVVNSVFQDILDHVITNPRQVVSTHWFQDLSLYSAISYINQFEWARKVNQKLMPLNIDIGGVMVSLAIILLVYFSYPFVFKCTSWCIERYIIDEGEENQVLIYHEIRRPARALLVFFGIDLATNAFFYRTDYRPVIDKITFVIYCLIIVWLLFKILDSMVLVHISRLKRSNKELRKELFNLGIQIVKAVILITALAVCFSYFGINITAILSTLGIGGLAFALAAKDTLSNFFGGITILFDNIYSMGDWVQIGDVEGTVAEIGLRSTTIRTFDNALITIPNSQVSVASVKNWNRRAVGRRIKMYIGVTYESNMEDIRQALDDIRTMLQEHPGIANPKQKNVVKRRHFRLSSQEDLQGIKTTQLVYLDRFNDFSIDILIYCFSRSVKWEEWLAVKEDVLFKLDEIIKKNNLEFAYPTQVWIQKDLGGENALASV
jgi:MscS family membrane protein